MNSRPTAPAAIVLALCATMAACGGGSSDDTKASPSASADPAATTSPPAPPTTPPSPPAQPTGAYGVTYEIQNWDQHATDPAVLAWKQTLEAVAGSVNARTLLEPVRAGMSKKVLRPYVSSLEQARDGNWHVAPVGTVRVESARTTGDRSTLTVCSWVPSVVYLTTDGRSPDGDEDLDNWMKETYELAVRDGRWKITSIVNEGTCPGGPPS